MKLIKTQDKFILASGKAEEGDIGYIPFEGGSIKTVGKYFADDWVKVISENPDFSLLNEEDCLEIGWVDIEKLAENYTKDGTKHYMEKTNVEEAFKDGLITAQSLNDKRFSLDDIRKSFYVAIQLGMNQSIAIDQNKPLQDEEVVFDRVIQSLQQTSWDVEVNENNQIIKIL